MVLSNAIDNIFDAFFVCTVVFSRLFLNVTRTGNKDSPSLFHHNFSSFKVRFNLNLSPTCDLSHLKCFLGNKNPLTNVYFLFLQPLLFQNKSLRDGDDFDLSFFQAININII